MTVDINSNTKRNPSASSSLRAEGVHDHAGKHRPIAAAAMLPTDLLHPDEIIILLLKPSPWFILLGPLRTVIMIVVAMLAVLVLQAYLPVLRIGQQEIILLGLALIGLRLFWEFLEWLARVYVLTDRRVLRVKGVLRLSVFETSLSHVQHTVLVFSIRERLLGLGSIGFATAGTGVVEAYWLMIDHPREVHRKVIEVLRRYRR